MQLHDSFELKGNNEHNIQYYQNIHLGKPHVSVHLLHIQCTIRRTFRVFLQCLKDLELVINQSCLLMPHQRPHKHCILPRSSWCIWSPLKFVRKAS